LFKSDRNYVIPDMTLINPCDLPQYVVCNPILHPDVALPNILTMCLNLRNVRKLIKARYFHRWDIILSAIKIACTIFVMKSEIECFILSYPKAHPWCCLFMYCIILQVCLEGRHILKNFNLKLNLTHRIYKVWYTIAILIIIEYSWGRIIQIIDYMHYIQIKK
jgi:hypothetical protein